ncbi:MAG: Na/Pi symporter [Pseudomonadales bacterium]|nr:Na/Pi cotransporter family protein [Pseudomonadales bacterium]
MWSIVGTFIGGLGLFLLAVSLISDGLRLAAGNSLHRILETSTRTPLRGVATGVLVTALVQSSSAVTVATIGFVNAGLLTLVQSLGIVYGANIGTTMAGWLVAAVGFDFSIDVLALPLIGIGMILRLLRPGSRVASVGEALAGFGLFFIGVDLLRDAFEGFSETVDVASFAPQGGLGIVLYVGLGFFMTVVTQASAAAIAITLTAATGGLIGIDAAAAMVIGANVGTTSTAMLAVIGATANARRVAAAHVIFNGMTGLVALALLPLLLWLVRNTGSALGLADVPAITLALFHTMFNLLGVLLMWPLTGRLAHFLMNRFTTDVELVAKLQFLDRNVMATPTLAIDALYREVIRASSLTRQLVAGAVSAEGGRDPSSAHLQQGVQDLINNIETFVTELEVTRLPEDMKGNLPLILRVIGYLEDVVWLVGELEEHRPDLDAIMLPPVIQEVATFQAAILAQVHSSDLTQATFSASESRLEFESLQRRWHNLKSVLLEAATQRLIPLHRLNSALEALRSALKMSEQLTKAAERLVALGVVPAGVVEAADQGHEGDTEKAAG